MQQWIEDIASRLNIQLDESQISQMSAYVRLLREWNERINLTAILDDEGIATRHLLDSLTLLPMLGNRHTLIDVGTGAGLPGIPLKIVQPDLQVTLLDALAKRVKFLEAVIDELQFSGIVARHARAEDAARMPSLREQFDIATARAVAALPALCEYCLPFVRPGGIFLAMKGQNTEKWQDAKPAIKILGGELADIQEFELPGTDMKRTVLTIRKISRTPPAYPRKAGKPEKEPIL